MVWQDRAEEKSNLLFFYVIALFVAGAGIVFQVLFFLFLAVQVKQAIRYWLWW